MTEATRAASIDASYGRTTAGLLGVDVTDIVNAGAGDPMIIYRRLDEIERRILALEAKQP
jgi:regulator of extracellular matrix RemA (YlzA/DUF370 family)